MSVVITGATVLLGERLFAGAGQLLGAVVQVVQDMRGGKKMCEQLMADMQEVTGRLERMLDEDSGIDIRSALLDYKALLVDMDVFFAIPWPSNPLSSLGHFYRLKGKVQDYNRKVAHIKELIDMDTSLNTARKIGCVEAALTILAEGRSNARKDEEAHCEEILSVLVKLSEQQEAEIKNLKFDLKRYAEAYLTDLPASIENALSSNSRYANIKLPVYYIPRDDLYFDADSPFETSDVRRIYHGTLQYSGTKVAVRAVTPPSGDTKVHTQFVNEVRKWYMLRDQHVLPLYGANDTGDTLLIVCEHAELGNFNQYLRVHRGRVWRVFLDVARGLAYLHSRKIVHGNLKCNNLLVTKHGVGVVSDFGFSFAREASMNLSAKVQTPSYNWKASECYAVKNSNPRVQSDIHSLGLCLYEAFTGQVPYANLDEAEAMALIRAGTLPERPPEDVLPEEAWDLIVAMCKKDYHLRTGLLDVIWILRELAETE